MAFPSPSTASAAGTDTSTWGAEVAKAAPAPNIRARASTMAITDLFFIFITATILSSRAFLLKLLQKGANPLLRSSI